MSGLPESYEFDYLVYSASNTFSEQDKLWDSELYEVVKRFMFKKFDNFVEKKMMESKRGNRR